jgi:rhodanese-related sulfurtransferase
MAPAAKTLDDYVREALREICEITPEEGLRRLSSDPSWHFVDVREPDEFAEGHVPGARNSPRGFLEVKADLEHHKRDPWLADRARPIVLYCGGGNRSALAARTLQEMGFTSVVSLAEGWKGWSVRNYPVER